jgi:hypothetical protein
VQAPVTVLFVDLEVTERMKRNMFDTGAVAQNPESDLLGHGAGRHEDSCFFSEQRGNPRLRRSITSPSP